MKFYEYIFVRLYKWNQKAFGNADLPALNALLHLSILVYINVLGLDLLLESLTGIEVINFNEPSIVVLVFLFMTILGLNYLLLLYKKKIEDYKETIDKKKGDTILIYYFVSTFAFFLVLLVMQW